MSGPARYSAIVPASLIPAISLLSTAIWNIYAMPSPTLRLIFPLPRKYQPSFFLNWKSGEGHMGVLWSTLLLKSTLIVPPVKGGEIMRGSLGGRQRDTAGRAWMCQGEICTPLDMPSDKLYIINRLWHSRGFLWICCPYFFLSLRKQNWAEGHWEDKPNWLWFRGTGDWTNVSPLWVWISAI